MNINNLKKLSLIILMISTLTACAQAVTGIQGGQIIVTPTETNSPLIDLILQGEQPTAAPDAQPLPTLEVDGAVESTEIVELLVEAPDDEEIIEPTKTPEDSPAFDPFCVPEQPNVTLAESAFDDYPAAIQAYLNAGGSAFGMDAVLVEYGLQYNIPAAYTLDLTNDGKFDVIVTIPNPGDPNDPPVGLLLVYYCDGVSYQLGFAEYSPEHGGIPTVLSTLDLNNDNVNEIIYSSSLVDDYARYEQMQVISWNGAYFEKRFEGSTAALPFPASQATDYDKDGVYQIEVVAKAVDSVEAGPTRDILHIWEYAHADGHWYPTQVIPGPSDFRIHVLQDADYALQAGEFMSAIVLYQQVIDSPDLRDWLAPEHERTMLSAYARFKIIVAYTIMGEVDHARSALDQLIKNTISGTPEYPYLELASAFWQGVTLSGWEEGCAKAQEYALFYPDKVLEPMGQQVFGYANHEYTPEMVCP